MGKDKEPLDALTGAVGSGIHLVATATLLAPGATREELDLAGLILRRNPERPAPRENESTLEAFNRILDVAIDSANDSAHCGTRAERRARLAEDLGRKGVVMIDHHALADLVEARLELDKTALGLIVEAPGPIPLLEGLELDPCENPYCDELDVCLVCSKGGEHFVAAPRDYAPASVISDEPFIGGLEVTAIWQNEAAALGFDRATDPELLHYSIDPRVND